MPSMQYQNEHKQFSLVYSVTSKHTSWDAPAVSPGQLYAPKVDQCFHRGS